MFFRKSIKNILTKSEIELVMQAVRLHEQATSGEIKIFIESKCPQANAFERAKLLFVQLKMHETVDRNAVLIYIAAEDKMFALCADKGIVEKADATFWNEEAKLLSAYFGRQEYLVGLQQCIARVGAILKLHFPWEGENKNELPDEIVFGK